MSEHVCIVVSAQNVARFNLCRALDHGSCPGIRVAARFDRYLSGREPLEFGFEQLCETASSCIVCDPMARLIYALFKRDPDGRYMENAKRTYVQSFYSEAARAWYVAHPRLSDWSQAEFDAMIDEKSKEAEAKWDSV